jgi:hypothetical protein
MNIATAKHRDDDSGDQPTATSEQLGTTLEEIERLELMLRPVISYDGFRYISGHPGLECETGDCGAHRCDYTITLCNGRSLGHIEFSRNTPFRESELLRLECCLAEFYLQLERLIPA